MGDTNTISEHTDTELDLIEYFQCKTGNTYKVRCYLKFKKTLKITILK